MTSKTEANSIKTYAKQLRDAGIDPAPKQKLLRELVALESRMSRLKKLERSRKDLQASRAVTRGTSEWRKLHQQIFRKPIKATSPDGDIDPPRFTDQQIESLRCQYRAFER